ncbi:MAG TPA: hypothetical protein VFU21_29510 [Kofleriaceae bacterium]|nr:hypothetical protein [Kofleriaceae bacterium]
MRTLVTLLALLLIGCGAARPPAGELRFHNRPPVQVVNDRLHVPRKPAERKYFRKLIWYDVHFQERLTRWMEMRPRRRAANVNSMDEVPDSTWFTNRIGVRDLTPDEIRRGPNLHGSPETHLPLTIKSSKVGGIAVGFIVEDARGEKYVLKFDMPEFPESETSTDVVTQRLVWAAGYNVPEDYVIFIRRKDLVMAPDAVVVNRMGDEEKMTRSFLDLQLSRIRVEKDGTIRALASRYLDGEPLGGHPREGVRRDDPNDRVPYELRRETRGAYAIFSWLDHTDMKEDNTLDMYVRDPADEQVRYVVHYLVDFGKALGMQALTGRFKPQGRSYALDLRDSAISLVSLGLWKRPWEDRRWPEHIPGVGMFESRTYDPGAWKANSPQYRPFLEADRFDNFWGAKILVRFTRAQIRAAVEQGRYSDPRAVDYITRTLVERQRKTARHWFARVAPLDRFAVESAGGARLCFEDLSLRYRLARSPARETRYRARAFAGDGRPLPWRVVATGTRDGRVCLPRLAVSASGADQYTIIRIETSRPDQNLPGVLVHIARDPQRGQLRVIGLRRL